MDEIKKAFKKAALKNHPDRGGDKEKFQEINQAHETLSDAQKRDVYDKYGEDGLKEGGGGGGGMDDILSQMFGMGGGRGGQREQGPKKMKPFKHPLKVTLEDVFNGKKTKIAVNRERICKKCTGKGGKDGAVQKCKGCQGRGMVTKMQQIGPGYYTQSTGPCDDC
jgi:DnaJ family protein A protein 2